MLPLFITVLLLGLAVYLAAKYFMPNVNMTRNSLFWMVLIAVAVLLALSGRLGFIVPLLGALLVLLVRVMQLLSPLIGPFLEKLLRERYQPDGAANRSSPPPRTNSRMTRAEALAILGLSENATKQEIIAAHRKLMQKLHPDRGGTDYLASQLNKARDVLL